MRETASSDRLYGGAATIELVDQVARGLPLAAVDSLADEIAPNDRAFKFGLVARATYNRRRGAAPGSARLSRPESERLVRTGRVWRFALEVWGDREAARAFMFSPHMLLDGKTPVQLTLSSELGGKMVEDVLGRLAYGSAA